MPYKDKKKKREYQKKYQKCYYQKHKKEKLIEYKIWRESHKAERSAYRETNREKLNASSRHWWRKHVLQIGNKRISGLNKRNYTGYCELCRKEKKKLAYHHWDDENPSKGMWTCERHHRLLEAYEKGDLAYLPKYLQLKQFINKQFGLKEKLKLELI